MCFTEIDEREQENVAGFSCFFKKTSPGAGEKRIAASLALLAMTWASVYAPKERRADLFPVIARRGKAPTRQSVSHEKNKSPDGGIDKLPNHVILKLKRGAAGRREPLNVALEK